jgi:hypothetical protein
MLGPSRSESETPQNATTPVIASVAPGRRAAAATTRSKLSPPTSSRNLVSTGSA